MKKQKKRAVVAAITIFFSSVVVMPNAMAVTPDNQAWVNGYWNTGTVLKGWLDWRSAVGWGTIGAGNAIITAASGASKGSITKAAFQFLCGTAAAGTLATWKPLSEPTTASHVKSTVKAAGVIAASSACGWVTTFAFSQIDKGIPPAQKFINAMGAGPYKQLQTDMGALNYEFLQFEEQMKVYADRVSRSTSALQSYSDGKCNNVTRQSGPCKVWWDDYQNAETGKKNALASLNSFGTKVHENMASVNALINS